MSDEVPTPPVWRAPDGAPLSCEEKIRVLNENWEEILQTCQDALEDAVLMGCDEAMAREALIAAAQAVRNPYKS